MGGIGGEAGLGIVGELHGTHGPPCEPPTGRQAEGDGHQPTE